MPGKHRAEGDEPRPRRLGNQPGERRLAGARRTPQDDRSKAVVLDGLAQGLAGRENVLLADELVEARRTHAFSEGSAGRGRGGRVGRRVVE
jgi:hypothetical protein